MGYLYDSEQPDRPFLWDADPERKRRSGMLYQDRVIVQNYRPFDTPWGVDTEPDGDPVYCLCSVSGRINKNSTFSKNWAQDNLTGGQLGMSETSMIQILAPEWHGTFYTHVWWKGDEYEVDGSPVELDNASVAARHTQVTLRRVSNHLFDGDCGPPTVPEGSRTWGA